MFEILIQNSIPYSPNFLTTQRKFDEWKKSWQSSDHLSTRFHSIPLMITTTIQFPLSWSIWRRSPEENLKSHWQEIDLLRHWLVCLPQVFRKTRQYQNINHLSGNIEWEKHHHLTEKWEKLCIARKLVIFSWFSVFFLFFFTYFFLENNVVCLKIYKFFVRFQFEMCIDGWKIEFI